MQAPTQGGPRRLIITLSWDKDTLGDYIHAKGLDLSKELFEIEPSEMFLCCPSNISASGILVDENCASTVPGLFAAGDCAHAMHLVLGAFVGGTVAGEEAAEYVAGIKEMPEIDEEQVRVERKRVFAPLRRRDGITYQEFEDIL